ncbi:adenosylcobinamide-GDP ribazoletransferase [Streptosporangium sp. NBC_01755]|uniref:adenosylcobinamide-GDP ribazoletransferase n=1 Tax=unclassified Streptosporangium TaxID=2632669 RepID=UPI002DD8F91C|nr:MULTISPECIES: adenosylcobinamide-GDP ribazoletransferase [unclassified Streptosporangium]WSA29660.1 adenosylcobinamide-GDP ribazoletransferase [Streptosporangium sp. NBC_01810]WSD04200.1 adenosylcobinamide-GDP ribazoletransferase [Streptosporangium sp. NBC_01755]
MPPPSDRPSTFTDGVRLAIGTLSVFPVRPGVVDRRAGGVAMAIAPLVGAALGAVAGLVLAVALWLGMTPLPASVLAVAALALLTRGLHLDGLADLADGLGSGKPAERALEIMKRSDIGPFGVVTLVCTLLLQVAALSELARAGMGPVVLVTACAAGRLTLTWSCRVGIPPARPDGLGAMVAGTVRRSVAVGMTALVLAGSAAPAFLRDADVLDVWSPSFPFLDAYEDNYRLISEIGSISASGGTAVAGLSDLVPWLGNLSASWGLPAAVLLGLLAAWVVRRRAVRRLGGITGDVLGALVEIATVTALLVSTVLVS